MCWLYGSLHHIRNEMSQDGTLEIFSAAIGDPLWSACMGLRSCSDALPVASLPEEEAETRPPRKLLRLVGWPARGGVRSIVVVLDL
jgi:hypothetical protein